ncbi:coproporphyrinogen III oxidase family protein [Patescibacteria group bacterium]|nr:coproporphyrinogen III oxidase family protein [Patescibacteria group bacterium]
MNKHIKFKESGSIVIPPYQKDAKLLLYVHIPFCQVLCTYCSFNRYKFQEDMAKQYFVSLKKELKMYADLGYKFESMYIGGGTPTIDMDALEDVVGTVQELYPVKEISIETNPNHITDPYIDRLKRIIMRLMLAKVESFDNKILKDMGRYEKYGSGEYIKELVKNAVGKFDTLNVDIIFNMPNQDRASLERDLDAIEEIMPEQVTFYPLMVSNNTTQMIEQNIGKVDYVKEREFYFAILDRIRKEFTGSTAWCFSRNSSMVDEYIVEYDDYIGAGSGAFGYINGLNYANTFNLEEYNAMISRGQLPVFAAKELSNFEQSKYFMMMNLFGLEMKSSKFKAKFGKEMFKSLLPEIAFLSSIGAVKVKGDSVVLTDKGMYYMIMVMREFFIGINNLRDFCRPSFEDLGICEGKSVNF